MLVLEPRRYCRSAASFHALRIDDDDMADVLPGQLLLVSTTV